ncbi:phosphoadenosine phosphosulfate reductase [Acidihalobacter yilgarnensis]|uniref:Adenosine 5'-phosphosulfate reductase n=1 Tax=Acidihalobacter yilgarnensis TaxID=2819280 RepID=A0A1D8ILW3_9GAMM|nr:phosphoadenylyl-sulfate reductase [Acidihalobacter yilgarnensis]AOU97442.1 phosphoadenosine phosphosulfate reductase [Acidihalobacter yilgarnensis]
MSPLPNTLPRKIDGVVETLRAAVREIAPVAFANSLGAEDMVLADLIYRYIPEINDFTLDTGRLPAETYELLEVVRQRYGRAPRVYFPRTEAVERYVSESGPNAFRGSVELRVRCCEIRKVEPLRRALQGYGAWVTGLRRGQALTRQTLDDRVWDGVNGLYKINPLADWQEAEVWAYIRAHRVPYNALHDKHYPSIGCAPCTRAIAQGEDVRAGRWWWEQPESRECGLHRSQTGRQA